MRGSRNDMPVAFDGMGIVMRDAEWGDMNVGLEHYPAGADSAPVFRGLPEDRCQCPHWGYVIDGQFRARFGDREEVFRAGDAYHLSPGHTTYFDEDTNLVEFSPSAGYRTTMAVVARNVAAMQMGA